MDEDLDPMITDDCSDSSIFVYSEISTCYNTEYSGSGISLDYPPSSGVSSGVSSGATSDSDLPPPPSSSSSKPSKPVPQIGLHNFFSTTLPAGKAHAAWSEKKRKNRDRDEEELAETKNRETEWKQHKLQVSHEKNRLSQQKHQKRVQDEEIKAGIRNEDGKKVQVRQIFMLKPADLLVSRWSLNQSKMFKYHHGLRLQLPLVLRRLS